MCIESLGEFIIDARKMSDKKLLTEIKKQASKREKYEDKHGILGNPYSGRLGDFKQVARDRNLL